ncbi:MAG TPA: acyltransferase [Erysipelotrichaceae bacterium]|nr:acyltransferase [Erysipelotrichaceae bacterium]
MFDGNLAYSPSEPELISIGNNVWITQNVSFITHDQTRNMLNLKYGVELFKQYFGCIQIGDSCMVGAKSIILPNVRIGDNIIIGAGSIVTKDVPSNTVVAEVSAKPICDFETFANKRRQNKGTTSPKELWNIFLEKKVMNYKEI